MNLKKKTGPNLSCAVNIENIALKYSRDQVSTVLRLQDKTQHPTSATFKTRESICLL